MEDNIPTGVTGVPELRLTADEDSAKQISQCFMVGKILSGKIIPKNKVQLIIRRVWFTQESVGVEPLRQMCSSFLLNRLMIEPESGHDGLGPLRDHISFCESEVLTMQSETSILAFYLSGCRYMVSHSSS